MADDGAGHERAARQVLAMAQSRDDQFLQLQALCSLAWFLGLAGRLEEALGAIEQAIPIAEEGDKVYRRSYLLGMKASFRHLLGERRAREELELATEINQAYRDTLNLDFAAQIAWETGELERAVAATVDQMAWDGGVSVRRAFGVAMAVMSLAEMGRLDEASELQATLDGAFRGKTSWVLSRLRGLVAGRHRRAVGGPARRARTPPPGHRGRPRQSVLDVGAVDGRRPRGIGGVRS